MTGACIFVLLISIGYTLAQKKELLSVHTVFRHGARAPLGGNNTEAARLHFYRGAGQLTDEGLREAELVGKILHGRYVNSSFLDKRMVPDEIEFRSSGVERCMMTSSRIANTMFDNITPPIDTMPQDDDYMLVPKFQCISKDYQEELRLTNEENEMVKKNVWAIGRIIKQRVAEKTKVLKDRPRENFSNLVIEKEAGLAVPEWFTNEAYKEAKHVFYESLAVYAGAGDYHHPSWLKFNSGFLLHTIQNNIKNKIECIEAENCSKNGKKKLHAYGTHDIAILALLESLGIREVALGVNSSPMYCALLIIELWLIDGKPKVQVLYRRDPDETTLMNLSKDVRNCGKDAEFCDADAFTSCCGEYITSTPKEDCLGSNYEEKSLWNHLNWILLAFCLVLILIIAILAYLVFSRKYETVDGYDLKSVN